MSAPGDSNQRMCTTLRAAYRALGLEGGSVLLAVSGGADSCALLVGTALVREALNLRVEVATLDHGLRPEARQEVESVVRLAARWGLTCHVRHLGVPPGVALEARAREARYGALESLRQERGLAAVATAHTASDQAETVLMRLARGSALKGAAGIQERREGVVRPLLTRSREEVEAFLAAHGISFVTDPMNLDRAFLRTRIRQEVVPALSAAVGYPVTPHLAAFAQLAAEDEALLTTLADGAWTRLRHADGSLDAGGLRTLERPLRRRVLVRLLTEAGARIDGPSLARVLEAVDTGGAVSLGGSSVRGGLHLRAMGGRVRCVRPEVPRPPEPPSRLEEGTALQVALGWGFRVEREAPPLGVLGLPLGEGVAWPLWVRPRQKGDRIRGPAGSRKLQDFLVDRRVPREARDSLPVVTDAAGVLLWIPGLWNSPVAGVVGGRFLWASPPGTSMPGVLPL